MIKEEGLCFKDKLITFPVSGFYFSEKTEIFCVELNLRKQKWLIFCCYNPHKHLIKDHLQRIKNAIDFHFKSYENIILIGDFNVQGLIQGVFGTGLPILSTLVWERQN